jgi:hypothetical protein
MKAWLKDIIALAIAMMLWYFSADVIRLFDPTAGADDMGIMQAVLFKAVILLVGHFFTKMFMRLFWTAVDEYLQGAFNHEFRLDTCYRRYYLALLCYWLCMIAWVIAAI